MQHFILVQSKISHRKPRLRNGAFTGTCHFRAYTSFVPYFTVFIPRDEGVDFAERDRNVDARSGENEGVHVDFGGEAVAEEREDYFDPFHQMYEKEVFVMDVHFVDEFVEFIFVAST